MHRRVLQPCSILPPAASVLRRVGVLVGSRLALTHPCPTTPVRSGDKLNKYAGLCVSCAGRGIRRYSRRRGARHGVRALGHGRALSPQVAAVIAFKQRFNTDNAITLLKIRAYFMLPIMRVSDQRLAEAIVTYHAGRASPRAARLRRRRSPRCAARARLRHTGVARQPRPARPRPAGDRARCRQGSDVHVQGRITLALPPDDIGSQHGGPVVRPSAVSTLRTMVLSTTNAVMVRRPPHAVDNVLAKRRTQAVAMPSAGPRGGVKPAGAGPHLRRSSGIARGRGLPLRDK